MQFYNWFLAYLNFLNNNRSIFFSAVKRVAIGQYNDPAVLKSKVQDLDDTFVGGLTGTQEALELAQRMFSEPKARPGVNDVLVVITDGMPTQALNPNLIGVADQLKNNGVTIVTIAIGEAPGVSLLEMVSAPIEENYFNITSFDGLSANTASIGKAIAICPNCPAPIGADSI